MRVAIIGAGMAGLSCAQKLRGAGIEPVLFDKGRGPGGRMATRRAEVEGETLHFDHGTQFFSASNSAFVAQVDSWQKAGVADIWEAAGAHAFVGTPSMNAPLKAMAATSDVRWAQRVEVIRRVDNKWHLSGEGLDHTCDVVVCAIPVEQAAVLLTDAAPDFARFAGAVDSDPCWAAMAVFSETLELSDVTRGRDAVAWASRNSSKPGREGRETWVIHGGERWSREHLELSPQEVGTMLVEAFFAETGITPCETVHLTAHRWRYSTPQPGKTPASLWDAQMRLGVAGDWLIGPNVEGAWLSGQSVAAQITSA